MQTQIHCDVSQQLKEREVSRSSTPISETVIYDTGQRITRKLEAIEAPDHSGIINTIFSHTQDPRANWEAEDGVHSRGMHPIVNVHDARPGYPELESFQSELVRSMLYTNWKVHTPAIFEVPVVALGHGNIHPLMLLHPIIIFNIVRGTIFPFERTHGLNLERG